MKSILNTTDMQDYYNTNTIKIVCAVFWIIIKHKTFINRVTGLFVPS